MATPSASKVVCLRAFNEDLNARSWQSQVPPLPPAPKRIAWPGGKIVSNKDEALASFLSRKLDRGETLTPEQMAMLERMADAKTSGRICSASNMAASDKNKRKYRDDKSESDEDARSEARELLQKLEAKVSPKSEKGRVREGTSAKSGRTVNLAALVNLGNRRSNKKLNREIPHATIERTAPRGNPSSASVSKMQKTGRRVLSDGRGGFSIAAGTSLSTTAPTSSASLGATSSSARTTFSITLEQYDVESRGSPHQRSTAKRARVVATDVKKGSELKAAATGSRMVARFAEISAAAGMAIPALYREAGLFDKGQGKGLKRVKVPTRGKGKVGKGIAAGRNVPGGRGEDSLEELMRGGLACSRA